MPAIAWANDDLPFTLIGGYTQTNPMSVGFDALVKTAIQVQNINSESHRLYLTNQYWGGAARSTFRYQFSHTASATNAGSSFATYTQQWVVFKNITDGRDLFRVKNLSLPAPAGNGTSNSQLQYWDGAAWVNVGAVVAIPANYSVHTFTIIIGDTGGVLQWHMNGALMAELLGDTKFTVSTTVDAISHYCWGNSGLGQFRNTFAEHILADSSYLSYGLRVTDKFINGAGTNNGQSSGSFTDVSSKIKDTSTVITIATVGNTMTALVEDLDTNLATSSIAGIQIGALLRRGDTGPQTAKIAYSLPSGGLQLSAAKTIPGVGYEPVAQTWALNPVTGVPFTYAELNAIEIGVQGAT